MVLVIAITLSLAALSSGLLFESRDRHGIPKLERFSSSLLAHEELSASYWLKLGQEELRNALYLQDNLRKGVAKNVILFLGDGMGIPTITAARIFKGQMAGADGEEGALTFEKLAHVGLSKTYTVNAQTSDSAGTATAYLTGVKTNSGMLGVTAAVERGNCSAALAPENQVSSIMAWALEAGMATGIVTTTRVTHATPGGAYAHSSDRDFESDADMPTTAGCPAAKDIARQLVEDYPGRGFKVILGGGRREFLPQDQSGRRKDGRNLISDWANRTGGIYVSSKPELQAAMANTRLPLFGLFSRSHLPEEYLRNKTTTPSLADMTIAAIRFLSNGPKGFVLLVEGGRIDHGHHAGQAKWALSETVAFDAAIEAALKLVKLDKTLVVVTADHSHTMTINGYQPRGNPITGTVPVSEADTDALPYTTLSYANGPGFADKFIVNEKGDVSRRNISGDDTDNYEYHVMAPVPISEESHGAEDVAIYAEGPMAHLFHGLHEQNYIAHVMGYAACIGPNKKHCNRLSSRQPDI